MAKLKQASLFEDDPELLELKERERALEEAHKKMISLPARLEKERKEQQSTMPPMAEIKEREILNRFEQNLSRGQVENVLRTQRHSIVLMFLLLVATCLMLYWAYRIMTT